jgi:hypothetical protein
MDPVTKAQQQFVLFALKAQLLRAQGYFASVT